MAKINKTSETSVVTTTTEKYHLSDTLWLERIIVNGEVKSDTLKTSNIIPYKKNKSFTLVPLYDIDLDFIKKVNVFHNEPNDMDNILNWYKNHTSFNVDDLDKIDLDKIYYMCYSNHGIYDKDLNRISLPINFEFPISRWNLTWLDNYFKEKGWLIGESTIKHGYDGDIDGYNNILYVKLLLPNDMTDIDIHLVRYGNERERLGISEAYNEPNYGDE